MHTVMPQAYSEINLLSTLRRRPEGWCYRSVLLVLLVVISWISEAQAGCTHAQPAGWYSQLRSDLPATMKAADNARWSGLFEVVYENGVFVYVAGASDNSLRLPRCGRDVEESLGQLALHFESSRPNVPQALQWLVPRRVQRPVSCYPSEFSLGQLLDGHLQLPEHPPRF
jgi:hypothetical protein